MSPGMSGRVGALGAKKDDFQIAAFQQEKDVEGWHAEDHLSWSGDERGE